MIDVLLYTVAAILGVVFTPLGILWAVNTLFSLGIAYTFWTWLAAFVLIAVFGSLK